MPVPGENPRLDAETRVPTVVGVSVVFVAVSTVVVLLRLYTRYAIVSAPGPDDLTIAIAQVLSIGVSVATILQGEFLLGRHVWMVSADESIKQLKCLFAAMLIYNLAQILTKTSFLLQYRRIFQDTRTRRACLWLLVILSLWGVTQEFLVAFACNPVALFIPSQGAVCIDSLAVWYLTSIMNIVTDFIIFLVPLPAIYTLQLPRKQKLLVAAVFSLGFFTCAISIVRLFTLHSAINTTDPTWDNVPSAYWSVVELNCAILCASLPPLRPLLRRLHVPGMSHAPGTANSSSSKNLDMDRKRRLSRNMNDHPAGGGANGIYSLADILGPRGGSQDALNQNAAEAGLAGYNLYRSPEYASRHSGGLQNSRLTNDIKGGKEEAGIVVEHHDASPGDEDDKEGNVKRVVTRSSRGIRVTREIGYDKREMDAVGRPF
ncbi:hypothetical protein B0T22DRAFT_37389 [Podospora appendiculata]|uniref:Rhodopsin domain-containing protein n=1 Tax=Podospora appendiculata TaxID=314037 RepID=A0AAE1CGH3_9PEZI|nr:hypothetical protein B0T22DRAFT_37389 [Podospora appendiculata]